MRDSFWLAGREVLRVRASQSTTSAIRAVGQDGAAGGGRALADGAGKTAGDELALARERGDGERDAAAGGGDDDGVFARRPRSRVRLGLAASASAPSSSGSSSPPSGSSGAPRTVRTSTASSRTVRTTRSSGIAYGSPSTVTSSAAIEASVSGSRSWRGRAPAGLRLERDLAAERAHALAHRVHPDAAAGHVGRRRRGREAGREQQLGGARRRRARRRPPTSSRPRATASWPIATGSIPRPSSRTRDDHVAAGVARRQLEHAGRRLAGGDALRRRLEPVVERVAHEVHERVAERVDDGAVELRVGALQPQLDLLAEPLRRGRARPAGSAGRPTRPGPSARA